MGFEVTSRPLTGGELKHSLTQAQALKFVFKPYSGLGMKAFYYSFTDGGIPIQGIEAINGTTIYAAALYTKTPADARARRPGKAGREALKGYRRFEPAITFWRGAGCSGRNGTRCRGPTSPLPGGDG